MCRLHGNGSMGAAWCIRGPFPGSFCVQFFQGSVCPENAFAKDAAAKAQDAKNSILPKKFC